MKTLGNIQPRLTTKEILSRAEARAQRDRWIAFCILVGTITALVVLVVRLEKGF